MRILLRALPSLRVVISAVLILVGLQLESARAQGTAGATNAASATNAARTPAQLEQILAPIALYPDALLSQIFMASTYPLEIVEAARWVQANPGLTGKAL